MTPKATALSELLDALQRLSERSDETAKAARRELWSNISETLGLSGAELAADLARHLVVQPITIRRWMTGEYAPRVLHLTELRAHWGVLPKQSARGGFGPAKDAPVAFDGDFIALRTLNHVFYCVERSVAFFVFKGQQALRIGRSQQVREQMIKILQDHPALVLYYLFGAQSEAANNLTGFKERQIVKESGVIPRIHGITMSESEDAWKLGLSPTSPLVICYGTEGRAEFRREVDVFYEVPVEETDAHNNVIDYGSTKSVFVQLPGEEALRTWSTWRPIVRALLQGKDIPFDANLLG